MSDFVIITIKAVAILELLGGLIAGFISVAGSDSGGLLMLGYIIGGAVAAAFTYAFSIIVEAAAKYLSEKESRQAANEQPA